MEVIERQHQVSKFGRYRKDESESVLSSGQDKRVENTIEKIFNITLIAQEEHGGGNEEFGRCHFTNQVMFELRTV